MSGDLQQSEFHASRSRLLARIFFELPNEHHLVQCLRQALEGPVKVSSNTSKEECHGKRLGIETIELKSLRYVDVSTVVYRMADFASRLV